VGWAAGLLTSLLLLVFLGVPVLIVIGGGAYLLIGWLRPGSQKSRALTREDEHEAMRRDLARLDGERADRIRRKAR
jgi:hypothetical protein